MRGREGGRTVRWGRYEESSLDGDCSAQTWRIEEKTWRHQGNSPLYATVRLVRQCPRSSNSIYLGRTTAHQTPSTTQRQHHPNCPAETVSLILRTTADTATRVTLQEEMEPQRPLSQGPPLVRAGIPISTDDSQSHALNHQAALPVRRRRLSMCLCVCAYKRERWQERHIHMAFIQK